MPSLYLRGIRTARVCCEGQCIIIITLKIPYVYCNKKLTSMPFSLYNYRPAVTLDGDHHHPQMTGDHPLVVSRANPAAAQVQAHLTGVHRQTHGAHHPRVRVVRAVADQVNLVRAEVPQAVETGVHLAQMIGVHLPVNLGRVAQAVVNRVRAEVDLEMDGEAGDLILVHGDQVPAVRVARAAQAAVNRVRAVVVQAHQIGVPAHQMVGVHHPRVNRASLVVDQVNLESLEEDQVDQETGVSLKTS